MPPADVHRPQGESATQKADLRQDKGLLHSTSHAANFNGGALGPEQEVPLQHRSQALQAGEGKGHPGRRHCEAHDIISARGRSQRLIPNPGYHQGRAFWTSPSPNLHLNYLLPASAFLFLSMNVEIACLGN
ncbi:MAG: hypothetical protein FRX49_09152 [Trebouxia sp. A1-2]|nr:MAG: hypothetical protein FRX49_09152 [Trebouxia sp. A1-2]